MAVKSNYGYDITTLRKRNFDRFDSGSTKGTEDKMQLVILSRDR